MLLCREELSSHYYRNEKTNFQKHSKEFIPETFRCYFYLEQGPPFIFSSLGYCLPSQENHATEKGALQKKKKAHYKISSLKKCNLPIFIDFLMAESILLPLGLNPEREDKRLLSSLPECIIQYTSLQILTNHRFSLVSSEMTKQTSHQSPYPYHI